MNKIDAHHHCWSISRQDYHWIGADHATWARDYLPRHLDPARRAAGVDKTILVQAAWTLAETNYLLGLADATDWIAGVIGWVDFEDPNQREQIARFANHPKLLGLRPMVQEIPQDNWVLRDDLTWAFEAIQHFDLVFEALGFARHAGTFGKLFNRHPDMRTVIDHGMKPQIAAGKFDDWAAEMRDVASQSNVHCKLSGLLTEAGPDSDADQLRPYVDHLLDIFGPDRLMWGSDWPVLNIAGTYAQWVAITETLLTGLNPVEQQAIWSGTATKFYRLEA